MKIKLQKAANKKLVYNITEIVTSVTWSGSDKQASRKVEFNIANSPFGDNFSFIKIEKGDIVYFYFDGKRKFVGRILRSTSSSSIGELSYSSMDYMNILLKSKMCYSFKNITPEGIAKKVVTDLGLKCGSFAKTKLNISKWLIDSDSGYNIIIGAYYKDFKSKGKKYMPYMNGIEVCVGLKGENSGVKLRLKTNVISTELEENAEDIINKVLIYDESGKKIGCVSDKESIKLFGIYQDILKKSEGNNAKSEANSMLKQPQKTAKVEAIGDIRCTAGKSIMLYDDITGLWGKFWIESDTHTIQNGIHKMSLSLSFQNFMEGSEEAPKSKYPLSTGDHVCYYSASGDKYHSTTKCSGVSAPIKTTVNEAVKFGKTKCLRCWQ